MALSMLVLTLALHTGSPALQTATMGSVSRTTIVFMPDAKKELKVTKDQEKKIQAALDKLQTDLQSGARQINLADPMSALDEELVPILDDAQKKRLEELFVQANSGLALADARVAVALGLTEEQKASAKSAKSSADKELIQMMMEARSASAANAIKKRKTELADKMLEILTPEQRGAFEAMKGKPFKFKD